MSAYLEGKAAIITCASRGIGYACAEAIAAKGARIAICSRNEAEIREAAEKIRQKNGSAVFSSRADMAKENEIEGFIDEAEKQVGPVDIFILNGPQPPAGPFFYHNLESWSKALDETIWYMIRILYRVVPGMQKRGFGRCVLIGSSFHLEPSSEFVLSSSIRLAQVGVLKCLAKDLASSGVTLNTICPGYADTRLTEKCASQVGLSTGKTKEEVLSEWAAATPMGRLIQPEEIGRLAAYLAAPRSASITGQVIAVDGGASRAI